MYFVDFEMKLWYKGVFLQEYVFLLINIIVSRTLLINIIVLRTFMIKSLYQS